MLYLLHVVTTFNKINIKCQLLKTTCQKTTNQWFPPNDDEQLIVDTWESIKDKLKTKTINEEKKDL